jgi:hypothetical protein
VLFSGDVDTGYFNVLRRASTIPIAGSSCSAPTKCSTTSVHGRGERRRPRQRVLAESTMSSPFGVATSCWKTRPSKSRVTRMAAAGSAHAAICRALAPAHCHDRLALARRQPSASTNCSMPAGPIPMPCSRWTLPIIRTSVSGEIVGLDSAQVPALDAHGLRSSAYGTAVQVPKPAPRALRPERPFSRMCPSSLNRVSGRAAEYFFVARRAVREAQLAELPRGRRSLHSSGRGQSRPAP